MKDTFTKLSQIDISGVKNWLITLAVIMFLTSIGLGWLVNGVLIIIGLLLLAPIVAVLFLGFWIKSNQVTDNCPLCNYEITGINGLQLECPSCGEPLQIQKGKINRIAPPGTIDVEAVEVQD